MLDDLEHLRTKSNLLRLLTHYVQLAGPDRTAWQDRLMAMDGLEAPGLCKLHGDLIAFGWIEQNTGNTCVLRAGAVPGCYRVTLAGLRAVRQIQALEAVDDQEEAPPTVDENPVLETLLHKREQSQEHELVAWSA